MYNPLGGCTLAYVGDGAVRCPITGELLRTGGRSVSSVYLPVKQPATRSRKLWLHTETELIIEHVRKTNYMNDNTNERRCPNSSGALRAT